MLLHKLELASEYGRYPMRTILMAVVLAFSLVTLTGAQEYPTPLVGHTYIYVGILCDSEEAATALGDAYGRGGAPAVTLAAAEANAVAHCLDIHAYPGRYAWLRITEVTQRSWLNGTILVTLIHGIVLSPSQDPNDVLPMYAFFENHVV